MANVTWPSRIAKTQAFSRFLSTMANPRTGPYRKMIADGRDLITSLDTMCTQLRTLSLVVEPTS